MERGRGYGNAGTLVWERGTQGHVGTRDRKCVGTRGDVRSGTQGSEIRDQGCEIGDVGT